MYCENTIRRAQMIVRLSAAIQALGNTGISRGHSKPLVSRVDEQF
jgi:hypothetical protein